MATPLTVHEKLQQFASELPWCSGSVGGFCGFITGQRALTMKKMKTVIELLDQLEKNGFTGFIRINYSQGGITKVEKNEEILKTTATREVKTL
jgi:hypothetical protein